MGELERERERKVYNEGNNMCKGLLRKGEGIETSTLGTLFCVRLANVCILPN